MAFANLVEIKDTSAAPLAPVEPSIDQLHLTRMSLGDRSLEREVLELFTRQADLLLGRMRESSPAVAMASAHTLKGSARGIGAWRVARAAEAVEQAIPAKFQAAVAALSIAIDDAKVAIAALLRGH
jgi:hypothetical protein